MKSSSVFCTCVICQALGQGVRLHPQLLGREVQEFVFSDKTVEDSQVVWARPSLWLKRLEATLTLTQASLTRRHRGRTCLLIREHALMANTQGSSWQKTLLALIGGIASAGTEKSILWIKRGLYVGTIYPSFFVQHVNEF